MIFVDLGVKPFDPWSGGVLARESGNLMGEVATGHAGEGVPRDGRWHRAPG